MPKVIHKQKDKLSEQQQKVLDYIANYIQEHDYSPTEEEIAAALGFTRTNAQYHLGSLQKKHRIVRRPKNGYRNIKVLA